jgi:hypothetical protein
VRGWLHGRSYACMCYGRGACGCACVWVGLLVHIQIAWDLKTDIWVVLLRCPDTARMVPGILAAFTKSRALDLDLARWDLN